MTELDLATGCKKGNNDARRYLYEAYANRMMGVCYRYAGSREEAEDLLHDCFIHLFESIKKFEYRGEGSLTAWIHRVCTNFALERLRRNRKIEIVPIDDSFEAEDIENDDFEAIPSENLMQFVAELPVGYRTVFNLYVFEDLAHREIAALLGIGEATSRTQYMRARNLLAKKIRRFIEEVV